MPEQQQYSVNRLERYFNYVGLPQETQIDLLKYRNAPTLSAPGSSIKHLKKLQQYQLAKVPFENLSLHYSPHHTVSLDPNDLYEKIVGNGRGRGGYCMENNCFFGIVLRSLGFRVYGVGARVNQNGVGEVEDFTGWSHMVNIVDLGNDGKVVVDVGFGNNGATEPLPLQSGHIISNLPPSSMRLSYRPTVTGSHTDHHVWMYEYRSSTDAPWVSVYCFTELEFLPKDYEVMNFWTSQSRKSWFTYRLVVTKMVMEGELLVGTLILSNQEIKRRLNGTTEHLASCESETQRLQALEEVFGIILTEEETQGIVGTCTALPM